MRIRGASALVAIGLLAGAVAIAPLSMASAPTAEIAKKKCKKKKSASSAKKRKCRKKKPAATPAPAPGPAQLSIVPAGHDFGLVDVLFTPHHNKTFTVTNAGGSTSGLLLTSVSGPNADKFPISNDTCNGTALGAGTSCTLVITFTPSGAGDTGARSATLYVTASPGGILAAPLAANGFV
jgi:hypothetical protein